MARMLGPDSGARLVLDVPLRHPAQGKPGRNVLIYTSEAADTLASIAEYDPETPTTPGDVIADSTLRLDAGSRLPLFWFPDGVYRVWGKMGGDQPFPLDVADSERVTALARSGYIFDTPARHGLKEWNYPLDNMGASGGQALTGGTIYCYRLDTRSGEQISAIKVVCGTAASALTANQCQAAIYSANGQTKLAQNTDISGLFGSTGEVSIPLAAAFTPAAETSLFVALLFVGTTPPALVRSAATGVTGPNFGLSSSSPRRYFTAGTSQTALPATITMASTTGSGGLSTWIGLA